MIKFEIQQKIRSELLRVLQARPHCMEFTGEVMQSNTLVSNQAQNVAEDVVSHIQCMYPFSACHHAHGYYSQETMTFPRLGSTALWPINDIISLADNMLYIRSMKLPFCHVKLLSISDTNLYADGQLVIWGYEHYTNNTEISCFHHA